MIEYRPFRNNDPPAIAEIWRHHAPLRGLVQPITIELLERHVFSKPYFDRAGLIVACDQDRPIGFVHAGFGANEDRSTVACRTGVISLLMVAPHDDRPAIAATLLNRGERYLREHGATTIRGGGKEPVNPFYLGLYGGAQLPGILRSDEEQSRLFRSSGYRELAETIIYQRRMAGFRAPVNRQQMQIRRTYQIEPLLDPTADCWWDACTLGSIDCTQFSLLSRGNTEPCGRALFWDLEPLASSWGVHASGLMRFEIDPSRRGQGLGSYLLGESLKKLQSQGVTLVEAQVAASDKPGTHLLDKFDFEEIERGMVFQKESTDGEVQAHVTS